MRKMITLLTVAIVFASCGAGEAEGTVIEVVDTTTTTDVETVVIDTTVVSDTVN